MTGDVELLERWAENDQRAADELMRRHYASVRRFFDLRASHVAEDLTQHTFLACAEQRDQLVNAQSFRSYLFGIARHQLLRHLRKAERHDRMLFFREVQGPDTAVTPSAMVAMREEQMLLLQALERLLPDAQIALVLFYVEGCQIPEIADVLEAPVSTVTSRLHRARASLRTHVAEMAPRRPAQDNLLRDLDAWARSLAGGPTPRS